MRRKLTKLDGRDRKSITISCRDLSEKTYGLAIAKKALKLRGSVTVKGSSYQKASSEIFEKWACAAHINLTKKKQTKFLKY